MNTDFTLRLMRQVMMTKCALAHPDYTTERLVNIVERYEHLYHTSTPLQNQTHPYAIEWRETLQNIDHVLRAIQYLGYTLQAALPSPMRTVTDILVQEPYTFAWVRYETFFEFVCPWCAETLCVLIRQPEHENPTYDMLQVMSEVHTHHCNQCAQAASGEPPTGVMKVIYGHVITE